MAITGWGLLSRPGSQPDNLQGANLNTEVKSGCQDRYSFVGAAPLACAGNRTKNACHGDSGGPMTAATVVGSRRTYHLLGVASFASPATCVENPSAYASLNNVAIVGWIRSVAGGQC